MTIRTLLFTVPRETGQFPKDVLMVLLAGWTLKIPVGFWKVWHFFLDGTGLKQ